MNFEYILLVILSISIHFENSREMRKLSFYNLSYSLILPILPFIFISISLTPNLFFLNFYSLGRYYTNCSIKTFIVF